MGNNNNKKKKNTRAGKKQEKERRNQDDLHRQQREYWNDYYGKQDREEDFYKDEWDVPYFLCIISSLSLNDQGQKKETVTLVPGCGMSSLSMKLHFLEGCKFKVVNIDISKKVIEEMKKLDADNNWKMSWEEMSMDKMDKFEDGYFDVIIDKAASNFIVPPKDLQTSSKFQQQRSKFLYDYWLEVRRLLKVGGTFIYFLPLEVRGEHEKTCLDSMLVYFRRGWDVIIHGPADDKPPIQNCKLNMVMVFFTKTTSQGDPSMVKWDINIDSDVGKTLKLFQVVQLENEERGYLSIYSDEDPKNKWNPNSKWILKSLENVSSHRRLHFNLGEYEGLNPNISYNALLLDSRKDDESQSYDYSVLCVPEKILHEWHTLSGEEQLHFVQKSNTSRLLMIFSRKWSDARFNWKRAIRKYFSSLSKLAPKKREDEVVIWWFGGTSFSCVKEDDFQIVGQVKLEKNGGNHEFISAKHTTGENFLAKDEETPPKETKDHNVSVEKVEDCDVLDQDKDKNQAIIGCCVDYFEKMGSIEIARMLEKESGYFNRRHFKHLVQGGEWKLLEDYLSHFFDIGESALLTKIRTWAFIDDLKRQGLPLPQRHWFEPDDPRESDLWGHLIKRKKDGVLIEDNTRSDKLDQDQSTIRSSADYFNEMGFTETSQMLGKKYGYFRKRHFEDLVQHGRWKLLEEYLSHFFDIGKYALSSRIKTWAFMGELKRDGLPSPKPKWVEPNDAQKESIISVLEELIPGKLKMRDELKLPKESVLLSHFTKSQLTGEGSDLVGVHRRLPGERKDVYIKIGKMAIFHEVIGEGKCTKVHEGLYENKPAAIKCIHTFNSNVKIHRREVLNLIHSEGHENVVKYYGQEMEEASYFIALEKCSFSLHDLFDKKKNFGKEIKSSWDPNYHPPTMLLGLIKDIIMGLDHLHSRRLIHRGLKPTSIMIKEECGKFHAKLSDMGFSKHISLEGDEFSTENSQVGPKDLIDDDDNRWKSPEQKRKDKKVGHYVDLYSLGYIIHYCLTEGRHPQDDDPTTNLENCPIRQLLFRLVNDFPEAYDIVSQLMSPEESKRPSAKQVRKHPFFWDSRTRNEFMRYASDWLDDERENHKNNHTKSPILAKLESRKVHIFGNAWDDKIDVDFVTYLRQNEPYVKFESVFDLVRVIRNKAGHFLQLQKNVKKDLIPGSSAHRLEEYFVRKFPKLFLEVYKIIYEFWKDEPTFQVYFA